MSRVGPTSIESPGYDAGSLDRKLRRLWMRQCMHTCARGGALLVLVATGLWLAGWLFDWLYVVPPMVRCLMLAGMLAALGVTGWRHLWTTLRSFDARRAALQIERHYPHLSSAPIAYVQLQHQPDGSPALVAMARQYASRLTEPLNVTELVTFRDLRSLAATAVLAMAMLIGAGWAWPGTLATFALRMVNPLSDRAYPARTSVVLLEDRAVLPRGATAMLIAQVQGQWPAAGWLELRYENDRRGSWESIPLPVNEQGQMVHRLPGLDRSLDYRFRAGDGRSGQGRIEIVPPPRLRQIAVTLEPPSYSGLPRQEQTDLNVRALEGTRVHLQLELDRPVLQVDWLTLDESGQEVTKVAMTLDDAGTHVSLQRPLETGEHRLRWTLAIEGATEPLVFEDPVRHRWQAVPDAPPQVQLLEPRNRTQPVTRQVRLPLRFRAADEYGLSEAWLIYRREGNDQEHRVALGPLSGRSVPAHDHLWLLAETVSEVQEGDRIEYTIEVADNREHPQGRLRGRATPWRSLQVLSAEQMLQILAERQVESFERLEQVRRQSRQSLDEVYRMEGEVPRQ